MKDLNISCIYAVVFRMERDRGFNFKLLVPPRVNNGQVSAVRPQESTGNCGGFMNTLQQVRLLSCEQTINTNV